MCLACGESVLGACLKREEHNLSVFSAYIRPDTRFECVARVLNTRIIVKFKENLQNIPEKACADALWVWTPLGI